MKKGPFSFEPNGLLKFLRSYQKQKDQTKKKLEAKMNAAVNIVYTTARARRPKISVQEHKASGGKRGSYRVSDPAAKLGVPVDTGVLQASIQKRVVWQGDKIIGEVTAGQGVPYAKMIEYGTSKMKARPFMRPALNQNVQYIKNLFKKKS